MFFQSINDRVNFKRSEATRKFDLRLMVKILIAEKDGPIVQQGGVNGIKFGVR